MRLFVCTYLSAETQTAFRHLCAPLIGRDRRLLRPVPADSLHITYVFFAEVAEERCPEIGAVTARVAERQATFDIRFGPPAILYGGGDARLVMAPVAEGAQELARLASALATALRTAVQIPAFKQTEHFHVTLARFRKGTTRSAATVIADALQSSSLPRREPITHLQVVASQLTARGPLYTTLETIGLGT